MSIEAKIADLEGRATASAVSQMLGPEAPSDEGFVEGGGSVGGAQADRDGVFRIENGKFTNCHFMFGRAVVSLLDTPLGGDGKYYLVVNHANVSASAITRIEDEENDPENDYTKTYVPLVWIANGFIVDDYRGMPVVPVYE